MHRSVYFTLSKISIAFQLYYAINSLMKYPFIMSPSLGLGDILFFFPPGHLSVCLSHLCSLYNLKTVQAILTKLHKNINQH